MDELIAVRRTVGSATVPAGDAKVMTLTRTYATDVEDVWDALTSPARIARWFLPVTGDLRVGGTYQLQGNAGGEIRVCERPHRLLVTWIFGEPAGSEDASFVEVVLESTADGGTRFQLEHRAVMPPEMWDQFGPGAVGVGWDLTLVGMAAHLAGEDIDPATVETDPAIHRVMTWSSGAWGEAFVASGADPDVAAALVAATTAFYVPPTD